MRYHRENDSVKSQLCEVTGGELTLAFGHLNFFFFFLIGNVFLVDGAS